MVEHRVFHLVGGDVALDFANTLDNRFDAARIEELLARYDDFVSFVEQSGVIDAANATRLNALPVREKQIALRAVRMVRELIEQIFSSVARGAKVDAEDLAAFNGWVQKALRNRKLIEEAGNVHWIWTDLSGSALAPLWPILLAAAELLTSENIGRVRECGAGTCRWLFLDLSKNRTRRWCDMKLCGNRSKARRYYQSHS